MLIRFSVENFMSYKNKVTFEMMASKITRHSSHVALCKDKRVLKGSYIFGANAAGKTNLLKAVAFSKNIIMKGVENVNFNKKYFRIDETCRNLPGIFQYEIFANNHFYSYGFAVSYQNSSIEEEWLYQIDDDKEKCIFLRSKEKGQERYSFYTELHFDSEENEKKFQVYSDDIKNIQMNKTLFLTDITTRVSNDVKEYQPFKDVKQWFEKLFIIFPESKYNGMMQLIENDNKKTKFETLLSYFDTGICGVKTEEIDFDKIFSSIPDEELDRIKTTIINSLKKGQSRVSIRSKNALIEIGLSNGALHAYEVVSNHGNADDLFEYNDESDGTQRLFDLIPLFNMILNGAVVLVDELDRSLHTKVAHEFIEYFYSLAVNKHSQLIVTTHDSNILDLNFIRQDEIWFVDRNKENSSILYSLNRYNERFDKKVEKEYLLGRYGAIPVFNQLLIDQGGSDDSCQ